MRKEVDRLKKGVELVLNIAKIAAGTKSTWVYHEPKLPQQLKK